MNKRLFVAGLPFSTTDAELRALFAPFGSVVSVKIITDRETGRSRGFGFVEMGSDEETDAAIKALHDSLFGGRKLVVNIAKPMEERPRSSGGYRGGGDRGGFSGGQRRSFGGGPRREGGRGSFGRDRRGGGQRGRSDRY